MDAVAFIWKKLGTSCENQPEAHTIIQAFNAIAKIVGIDPVGHRKFLNKFYTGDYPGSFATRVPFQFNADTGDFRISGTFSFLAGLEDALLKKDSKLIELAVRRINLLRTIMVSFCGIPLLYIGDEWGMLHDYTYWLDIS